MSDEPLYRIVYADGRRGVPHQWPTMLRWVQTFRRDGRPEARPVRVERVVRHRGSFQSRAPISRRGIKAFYESLLNDLETAARSSLLVPVSEVEKARADERARMLKLIAREFSRGDTDDEAVFLFVKETQDLVRADERAKVVALIQRLRDACRDTGSPVVPTPVAEAISALTGWMDSIEARFAPEVER